MILIGWIFAGIMAAIATGVALLTSDDGMAILFGIIGFVSWGIWSYGALNIQVYRDATVYTISEPVLAIVGVLLALPSAYVALTGPVEIVQRYRDARAQDV